MKEQKKDQFLVNMGEEITSDKKYIDSPIIKKESKDLKKVKIGNDTIELSQTYYNAFELNKNLEKGAEKLIDSVRTYSKKDDVYSYGVKCFENYKLYLKDVINLCYFDLELSENHMDLIYQMIYNTMFELNNKIVKNSNEFTDKINRLAREHDESQENIKRQEMIDYISSPTYVTSNTYSGGLMTDSTTYGAAFKMGKPPTSSFNSYAYEFYLQRTYDSRKEYIDNDFNIVINDVKEFNEKFKRFIYEKAKNMFSKEYSNYINKDKWLNYIPDSNKNELENIKECCLFYEIDLKDKIEDIVVECVLKSKEINDNYLKFYKLINDDKEIDVSNKLVDKYSNSIIELVETKTKIDDKKKTLDNEITKLDSIKYLNKNDIKLVISNVENNINNYKKKQETIKQEKNNHTKKVLLIIAGIIAGLAILALLIFLFPQFFKTIFYIIIIIGVIILLFEFLGNLF